MKNSFLFDVATRQRLLSERVGLYFYEFSNSQFNELAKVINWELSSIRYENLDELSKTELNKVILALRKKQLLHFTKYNETILSMLLNYTEVHKNLSKIVHASVFKFSIDNDYSPQGINEEDAQTIFTDNEKDNSIYPLPLIIYNSKQNTDKLFSLLKANIIGASGLTLLQMLNNLKNSSIMSVENAIRQAWANKQKLSDLLKTISGGKSELTGNDVVTKNANGSNGILSTILSYITESISSGVQSVLYNKYVWVAILDGRTSQICLNLNGKIFVFGKGPIPPAHFRCRSHIVAIGNDTDENLTDETFTEWVKRQPNSVKENLGGTSNGQYVPNKPLDIDDYGKSANIILSQ